MGASAESAESAHLCGTREMTELHSAICSLMLGGFSAMGPVLRAATASGLSPPVSVRRRTKARRSPMVSSDEGWKLSFRVSADDMNTYLRTERCPA